MTEQEHMNLKGVGFAMGGYAVDKTRRPHGMTERQRRRFEKEAAATEKECVLSIAGFGIPHQFFSPVTT